MIRLRETFREFHTLSRKRTFSYLKNRFTGLILIMITSISCDSENANDCLQTDGTIVEFTLNLPDFDKIQMEDDIRVLLKDGPEQEVRVETGENLVSDLNFEVREGTLILQNNNSCNILREYGRTLVKITSPNISFIRQASAFEIESDGVLSYPELFIRSNTNPNPFNIEDPNKSGRVTLSLDVNSFRVSANGSSNFEISGRANEANITFADEFPQFNGRNFLIDNVTFLHTGAANMILNPQNSLIGTIRATGNVICTQEPPVVDVEVLFTGNLIFEN